MRKLRPATLTLGVCLLSAAIIGVNVVPANAALLNINLGSLSVSTTLGVPLNVQANITADNRVQVSWSRPNLSVLQTLTGYVVKIVNGSGTVVETDTVDGNTNTVTSNVLPSGTYTAQVSTIVGGLISLPASSGLLSISATVPTTTPTTAPSSAAPVIDVNLPIVQPTTEPSTQNPINVPSTSTPTTTTAPNPQPSVSETVPAPAPSQSATSTPSTAPTTSTPSTGTPTPQPTLVVAPGTPTDGTPAAVATISAAVLSPTELQLSWPAPKGAFTHFKLKVEGRGYSRTFTTTLTGYRLKKLKPGAYMIQVSTCNDNRCTAWKDMRLASTALPGQVKRVSASKARAHTALVKWSKPSTNGGKAIRRYLVTVQAKQGAKWGKARVVGVSRGTSIKLTKLKGHTRYRVHVAALNGQARSYTKALAGKHSKYRYFKTR